MISDACRNQNRGAPCESWRGIHMRFAQYSAILNNQPYSVARRLSREMLCHRHTIIFGRIARCNNILYAGGISPRAQANPAWLRSMPYGSYVIAAIASLIAAISRHLASSLYVIISRERPRSSIIINYARLFWRSRSCELLSSTRHLVNLCHIWLACLSSWPAMLKWCWLAWRAQSINLQISRSVIVCPSRRHGSSISSAQIFEAYENEIIALTVPALPSTLHGVYWVISSSVI